MVNRVLTELRLLILYLRRYRRDAELLDARDIKSAFDTDFYLTTNEDVALAGVDPILHYLRDGWREKRDPCPEFSTTYYLRQYGDVRLWGVNPFVHYVRFGRREARTPKAFVSPSSGDMASLSGSSHEKAIFDHFEGRMLEPGLKTPNFDFPCVLLAFTNRSGSNLLADYLGQTELFLPPQEFLGAEFVIETSLAHKIEWFSQFFSGVQRHDVGDSGKLFVFKASWGQIAMLARWEILKMHPAVKVIHVKRRDLVGQAVSMSIAEQTGNWSSTIARKGEHSFDFKRIRHHLAHASFANGAIETLCCVLGYHRIEVFYEDLVEDPPAAIQRIGKFFGKDLSDWEPKAPMLKKQADEANERYRIRFIEEFKAKFGFGDASGRETG